MLRAVFPLAILGLIAACGPSAPEPGPQQRIELAEPVAIREVPLASPDTSKATWIVDEGGQSISFGNSATEPMMTLDCRLTEDPPQLAVIRHAPARPGQSALFPVIGNGMRVRFLVDATLRDNEWRWEGLLPADDAQLDVFTGPRDIEATLPGGGTLAIKGSRIPGEFVTWCRAGGDMVEAEADENAEVAENADGAQRPVSAAEQAP